MERVLLVRENTFFKGYPVVPYPVASYPSLSQFVPKPMIDSYLTFTIPNYSKHFPRECVNRYQSLRTKK